MKKAILILTAIALFLWIGADVYAQKKKTETVTFTTSIHCDNCKKRVEDNVPFEKGVKDIEVDVETKKVTVHFDPAKTDPETLRKAIEKLGYIAVRDSEPEDDGGKE